MSANIEQVRRAVMRRVWYSYLIGVVAHPMTVRGALFGVSIMLIKELVHVRSVIDNLLQTSVGNVPAYVSNTVLVALQNGEFMTLLACGVLIFTALSVSPRMIRALVPAPALSRPTLQA